MLFWIVFAFFGCVSTESPVTYPYMGKFGEFGGDNEEFRHGGHITHGGLRGGNEDGHGSFGGGFGKGGGQITLNKGTGISKGGYSCGSGKALNAFGQCVPAIINRNIFLYKSPPLSRVDLPVPHVPTPRIDYDLVFLRSPDRDETPEPIIVPGNERRTAVFLLNKKQPIEGPKLIEPPEIPHQSPEVYYVNYDEGADVELPGGINLQDALSAAHFQQGQEIAGSGEFGVLGSFGGDITDEDDVGEVGVIEDFEGSFVDHEDHVDRHGGLGSKHESGHERPYP